MSIYQKINCIKIQNSAIVIFLYCIIIPLHWIYEGFRNNVSYKTEIVQIPSKTEAEDYKTLHFSLKENRKRRRTITLVLDFNSK